MLINAISHISLEGCMRNIALLTITLGLIGPNAIAADESEENIGIVKAMVTAINQRDFGALDRLVAADVVRHSAATPGLTVTNLQQFKAFLEADLKAVPDSKQTIEMIFGSGDMVAIRAIYEGTQSGAMGALSRQR